MVGASLPSFLRMHNATTRRRLQPTAVFPAGEFSLMLATMPGFSWRRASGLSAAKGRISRAIGIPLSRSGRQKKIGRIVGGIAAPLVGDESAQHENNGDIQRGAHGADAIVGFLVLGAIAAALVQQRWSTLVVGFIVAILANRFLKQFASLKEALGAFAVVGVCWAAYRWESWLLLLVGLAVLSGMANLLSGARKETASARDDGSGKDPTDRGS
jgi:hypothetical protein